MGSARHTASTLLRVVPVGGAGSYVPAAHATHADWLTSAAYVPGAQGAQAAPGGP